MITKITFEDHGQDFLVWEITDHDEIIRCEPFQASIWTKFKVKNRAVLRVGGFIKIAKGRQSLTIKYPIAVIEHLPI